MKGQAATNGWGEDFEEFLDVQLPGLSRLAMALTHNVHAAQDLTQNAVIRAYQRWDRVSKARDPGAYSRRLLVNLFLSDSRARRHLVRLVDDLPATSSDGPATVESRAVILQLLAMLPPRQQAAVVLRYLEDCSTAEIAEILSCKEATVRSLIKRGLDTIRRADADEDSQPIHHMSHR